MVRTLRFKYSAASGGVMISFIRITPTRIFCLENGWLRFQQECIKSNKPAWFLGNSLRCHTWFDRVYLFDSNLYHRFGPWPFSFLLPLCHLFKEISAAQ